ncbi:hypothetical protein KKH27_01365 [bacterium]|nr:hypothetical protein [bacterium]MBU1984549.1 hypothetical protein [bacterium]
MSSRPEPPSEIVEPLRRFLETFTQELTEQQFIPAFRDELKRLLNSLDGLQRSETVLQQIAQSVVQLQEVFTPAGTRLLEGARELEEAMRANASQVRGQAEDVLRDLLETHQKLESSLRSEAGLIQEHTNVGREALDRTVGEIEDRLKGLTTHLESLCERMNSEVTAAVESARPAASEPEAVLPSMATVVGIPDDLKDLLQRTQEAIGERLEEQRREIAEALSQVRSEESQRLLKLDQRVSEALASVGPQVQGELESAVGRLRDQIQTLILAEMETRRLAPRDDGEPQAAVPTAEFTSSLAASETRILREIAVLQKSGRGEQSEAERLLRELARGLEDVAEQNLQRAEAESRSVKESLGTLQRIVGQLRDGGQQDREQLAAMLTHLDTLVKGQREQQQLAESELHTTRTKLDEQTRLLEQKIEDDRQVLGQLSAAVGRAEQAATKAIELSLSDGRAQRDKIESGIKELRDRLDRAQQAEEGRTENTLRHIAEAWTEALEALRDFVQKAIAGRTDAIITRLEGLDARLAESGQSGGNLQRDVQNELRRISSLFDERLEGLKSTTESFTTAMESHVKAVSGEVAALRSKQEQSLAVLKEAIRANYDESAARLKEVVETAYDSFIKQTSNIPQVIDRFTHLLQSLHQSDSLALQTIGSDTKNVLSLASERFETLVADNNAIKKFFPLLDKKLEKHSTELDMVRKAQVRQDQDLAEFPRTLSELRQWHDEQLRELRGELQRMREDAREQSDHVRGDLHDVKSEQSALQNEDLPTFRREVSQLVTSKLEFIENTLHERQESLRKEMDQAIERSRLSGRKTFLIVAALVGLSILLQIAFHFASTPGTGG